jgi:hypothetical protein
MNLRISALFLGICILTSVGCAALVAGTVAGVGVYTYVKGELKRSYQATYEETLRASLQTLQVLQIRVAEKTSDGIETRIRGYRRDGTGVSVEVRTLTPAITEVSVRTGFVGFFDREFSELVHVGIAQRLQS